MRAQQYFTGESVLEASRRRVSFILDHYGEKTIVSVSGGKDSTVLAHLALTEAHRRGIRIGVFLLDEEVLYQSSVEQVEYIMGLFPNNTRPMWLQIPFMLTNATSRVEDGQLRAWEPGEHKLWMRPKKDWAMKGKPWREETERFKQGYDWLDFYGVIENFERCHPDHAFLVGLRAQGESFNRFLAVRKNPVLVGGRKVYWGTNRHTGVQTFYPIFDWNFSDVWRYIHDEGLRYSRIYDYQHKKGYSPDRMRVSSLIHERSFRCLTDLQEFEPKTYARLLKRVKGVALAAETGKAAKLFRVSKLPKNFKSWVAYRDFLLATHPDEERRPLFVARFAKHLQNEYVARQQCRQLILNDYENNLAVDNKPDPRDELIRYYDEVL